MRVSCPSCGRTIPARDVNLDRSVANCTECDEVFWVRAPRPGPPRPEVRKPSDVTVRTAEPLPGLDSGAYRSPADTLQQRPLVLRYGLLRMPKVGAAGAARLWGFPAIALLVAALIQPSPAPFIMVLFLAGFVLAQLLNTTEVRVDREAIRVITRPLPWPRGVTVQTETVRRVFARTSPRDPTDRQWQLVAEMDDGKRVCLLPRLPTRDHAMFMERAIEEHLGLGDDPPADADPVRG